MRQESIQKTKNGIEKDISKSYNQFKEFEGKKYTGMKVVELINGIMTKENGKKKK